MGTIAIASISMLINIGLFAYIFKKNSYADRKLYKQLIENIDDYLSTGIATKESFEQSNQRAELQYKLDKML